jgi:threonine/homoserine/homoserine lactone efflux protein
MLGIHDLAWFVLSGLLLNIMPGPDSLLIMTRSATQGWRAGCAAALGIGTGTFVHIVAAALGLSAILATSAAAFTVVKLLGAAYILYLAVGMLLSKRRAGDVATPPAPAPLPLRRIYAQGILTNVLNPKVALFFLAFVPQFIDANAPHKALAFLLLGAIFNINGMLWCHALALFTAQARARLKPNPAVTQWLNRATGGLFVWLGVKLALAKQH